MLILNGKPLSYDRAFTHAGIQYPANWLRLSSLAEKQAIGITEAADDPVYDQRFYWGPSTPKQLNDVTETVDGEEVTTTGLKTLWSNMQDDISNSLLATSDWRVVKASETSTDISTVWATYRAAVRTACNTRQTEISNVTTVEALKELFYGAAEVIQTREQQQTDADGNGVVDDDGNPVMENVNVTEEQPRLDADGNAAVDEDGNAITDTVNVIIANPGLATAWPTAPA